MSSLLLSVARLVSPHRFPPSPLRDEASPMRAVVMRRHGDASVLEYVTDFPSPAPAPNANQVTVDIVAAGLNPVDFKMRRGPIADFVYPKPKIIGSDFAGVIREIPPNSKFLVGQRVFGMLPLLGTSFGGYAARCCVDEDTICAAPVGVSLRDLGSIPLVACTVVKALRPVVAHYTARGEGTKGKKIFITAGSGGVGTLAIQYCGNVLGMEVGTSCSGRNEGLVRRLGAVHVVDYATQRLDEAVRGYDVLLDCLGASLEADVYRTAAAGAAGDTGTGMVRPGGHYIRIASSPHGGSGGDDPLGLSIPEARLDRVASGFRKAAVSRLAASSSSAAIHYHFVFVTPDAQALQTIAEAMRDGRIRAVVQEAIPLAEARRAHEVLEAGHVVGKLVLAVDPGHIDNEAHMAASNTEPPSDAAAPS